MMVIRLGALIRTILHVGKQRLNSETQCVYAYRPVDTLYLCGYRHTGSHQQGYGIKRRGGSLQTSFFGVTDFKKLDNL